MRSKFHLVTFPFFRVLNTYLCLQTFVWLCCDSSPNTVTAESKKPPCFMPPFTEVSDMSLFCVFTAKLFAVLPFGENTHTHKELCWIYLPPHIVMLLVEAHLQNGKKTAGYGAPTMRELTMRVPSIWTQIKQEWWGLRNFLQARYESNYLTCLPQFCICFNMQVVAYQRGPATAILRIIFQFFHQALVLHMHNSWSIHIV